MVKELQYTSIKRVLDNLTEHPLLRDLTLEQVVRYTVRFISIHGYPKLFEDKIADINIHEFRGELPCDLVSIIQVKDLKSGVCLRSMTDNFAKGMLPKDKKECHPKDLLNNVRKERFYKHQYIPPILEYTEEPSFKTQGRVIYTSFPHGVIGVAYKSIPIDNDGYPMIVDNENFLAALEAYIKKTVFTIKFDTGKINLNVLQNAQKDYAWLAGQLESEFLQPSQSEMETLTRALNTLIPRMTDFDKGFKHLGDREYLRKH